MDLDAFSAVHAASWRRLDELVRRKRRTGAEADELVRLYQEVATHLSMVRSAAPDPAVISRLSELLGRARAAIAGSHDPSWRDVGRFFVETLPAALYRVRWWSIAVTVASVAIAVVAGAWFVSSPEAQAAAGPPGALRSYAEQAFQNYYVEYDGASFAAMVWTNNAWIAATCVAFGITGLWPLYVLFNNAVNVGVAGGILALHDGLPVFFQLILPHGLLELTAVFVAGGTGLKLFWTMVDPGGRPRSRALAEEGRALFTVAIGLVAVLGVSGLIEGFVTPSTVLPWWLKIVVGVVAFGLFWAYVWIVGRAAVRAGATGDLRRGEGADLVPLAA
ncbi:stage II sporulation protein M [Actinotalea sp. M2MS4P-6]|uniref:stage II sporulation protein M n=1 Tax=Actinotalea sp. M2MS4P-6 TaxID=2983762 RepID=UPI0021E470B2|nr:stage II sporulation protein M [Actinotalea sp. M2MS4P-6]MCV2394152.1 stage II sporulation protein M [Actinotalea sp. M2MS4P-6]